MKPRPLALAAAGRQSLDSATRRSRSRLPAAGAKSLPTARRKLSSSERVCPTRLEVAGRQPGGEVGGGHRGQPALALLRPLGDVGGQGGGRLEPQPGGAPQPPGQRPEEAPAGPPALRRGEQDAPRVARVGALQPGHGGLGQDALGPLDRVAGRSRVDERRRQRGVADQGPLRVGPAAQVDGGVLGDGGLAAPGSGGGRAPPRRCRSARGSAARPRRSAPSTGQASDSSGAVPRPSSIRSRPTRTASWARPPLPTLTRAGRSALP